jgi:hypothetical protein
VETFLFDDFFVPADDAGVEDTVEINGRDIPMTFKRALTLRDREEAKAKAVKTVINKDGSMSVAGVDEGTFTVEILFRTILAWPFTYKDGSPVPVTRAILQSMIANGADALQAKVLSYMAPKREALVPFENPSDAA